MKSLGPNFTQIHTIRQITAKTATGNNFQPEIEINEYSTRVVKITQVVYYSSSTRVLE